MLIPKGIHRVTRDFPGFLSNDKVTGLYRLKEEEVRNEEISCEGFVPECLRGGMNTTVCVGVTKFKLTHNLCVQYGYRLEYQDVTDYMYCLFI